MTVNATMLVQLLTGLYIVGAVVLLSVVALAIRRWSLAAELKAQAFDRLVTAIEQGALTRAAPAPPADDRR